MDNDNSDLLKLDKVFPHLHDTGKFNLSICIPSDIEFVTSSGFKYIVEDEISNLLTKNGYAIVTKENYPDYIAELTSKGCDAKAAGGHFAYLKQLADKEQKEQERQHRKDRIDQVDFLSKTWAYKFRYLLYIASFGGLAVSIFTYFKPDKEPKDLAPMKQEMQEVKSKMKELDSLFRVDSLLKKDTSRHQ